MYIKVIFYVLLVYILSLIQLFFISGLPFLFSRLNIVLLTLIFFLVLSDFYTTLKIGIGLALLLDVYSFYPFGVYLITILIIILILYYLLEDFFTNRSIYTFLAMGLIATALYEFFVNILKFGYKLFIDNSAYMFLSKDFLLNFIGEIFINSLGIIIIFYSINMLSHRLKPIFLWKK
jgi:hypothetical protein